MKIKLLLLINIFIFGFNCFSQQIWKLNTPALQNKVVENSKEHKLLVLDNNSFLSLVKGVSDRTSSKKKSSTILLPVENNTFEAFEMVGASNFSEELALKFPEIKSYVGKSTQSNKVVRLSFSEHNGLRAFITAGNEITLIKPTDLKTNTYAVSNRKESESLSDFECGVVEEVHEHSHKKTANAKISTTDGYLRKYRLALATTGEYSNYFLTGNETSDLERKTVVLAALNTTLTRINGILERDLGITLELVPENDRVIHLNATTDPFTFFGEQLLPVVQNHLDAEIGSVNYDIGHLLAHRFRNYGIAYPASVCRDGFAGKGSAFSSGPNLAADNFYMVFAHELGHQLGTNHVQSSSACRDPYEAGTAVEPGSGSTIMSYAGICSPSVQNSIDSYYNYVSIRDVISVTEGSGCGELISTGNHAPTADAGSDYTIPKSTPFILEGTAEDADNNSTLSYTWEQIDTESPNSNSTPQPTWVYGPLFRSYTPTDVPVRYMPKLEDVVAGNLTPTWDVLPSVSRTMDFAFTVRDNAVFGSHTASDEMTVTVEGNSGPFAVTSQNSSTIWQVGEVKTITWNVANTDQAPINTSTVAIYLSTDGGYTYPITVVTNVPNTGSYDIVVPEVPASTSTARLMVRAENNVFYAINASDININLSEFFMSLSESEKDVCKDEDAVFVFDYKTVSGFNEMTTFSMENLPNGVTATFDPATAINNNTEVTLTISGLDNLNQNSYETTIVGNTISAQRNVNIRLNLFENLSKPTLISPENNTSQIIPNSALVWEAVQNTEAFFTIELASDPGFSNIIEQTITTENTFIPSQTEFNADYYWRVLSDNVCGTSDFSEVFTFKTKCNDPSNITMTDIAYNTATISWTDNSSSSWEIRIIENAPTPIEKIITTNTNSYIISALNSSTDYDVFVRSLCASDFSNWIGPQKFTTPAKCPVPSDFVADLAGNLSWTSNGSETVWELEYGVEGFSPGTGTKVLTSTNPHAMEGLNPGALYDVYLTAICGANPGSDDSQQVGPVLVDFYEINCNTEKFYDYGGPEGNYGKDDYYIILFKASSAPLTITFNAFDLAEDDYLFVNTEDGSRFYYGTDGPRTITLESGSVFFRFESVSEETSTGWEATVTCGAISCPMPSDFVIDDITFNSVDLSWTSNGIETQWELEYGIKGFTPGQGTTVLTSANPYTLTGLSEDTDYEIYLKAICGLNSGDNDSNVVVPIDFNLSEVLGVSEVSFFDGFKFYPTPVNNKLTVESNEEITKVEIYNLVGQLITTNQERLKERVEIDFSYLSVGIYYIRSYSYGKIRTFRIIKQ
ncbi:reprolysin-like metallopeptidase [Flavivirga jejuensis]|uniref:M12 family metallo-peptidase n=1 Tax=Flavivirga jejuensis TaxID=870487 RepID=A0ABT8WSC7_9FLAO|nr:zinc-dependent metalloprotease family protein [Flavivirga jejuensis]MDO5976097.1 M12 family metallo-peptidase [Flavivirga jejuensis]